MGIFNLGPPIGSALASPASLAAMTAGALLCRGRDRVLTAVLVYFRVLEPVRGRFVPRRPPPAGAKLRPGDYRLFQQKVLAVAALASGAATIIYGLATRHPVHRCARKGTSAGQVAI